MKEFLGIVFILFGLSLNAQMTKFNLGDITDLEDYNKTMVILEQIFDLKPSSDALQRISTSSFKNSKNYKQLQKLIDSNFINLGYTKEILKKQFAVGGKSSKLIIIFGRHPDSFWYINDSYLISNGRKTEFDKKGFKPLAIEYNFVDLIESIEDETISSFSGLAPHGKLPVDFVTSNDIEITQQSTLYIKDVIIFHLDKIKGIYTIKLTNRNSLKHGQMGWLVDDFILSSDAEERTLLVNYLLKETQQYNLSKKSNYFYENLKLINNSSEDQDD